MLEILNNRVIIEVVGKDAFKLLQNLSTNNLESGKLLYSYMLSSQGKYLFDFFVFRVNTNEYLIDIGAQEAEAFVSYLNLFKLRSEVKISAANNKYKIIYSSEPLQDNFICSNKDPRFNKLKFRSIIYSEKQQYFSELSSNGLYLEDKYKFAIPDGNIDLVKEKSFPIEYGAEELNAISYSKGCYAGQEVVSRTKYQGIIRKKIYKIIADSSLSLIPKGAEIQIREKDATKKIGIFCSGHDLTGIALIKEEYIIDQCEIYLNEALITIEKPEWRI